MYRRDGPTDNCTDARDWRELRLVERAVYLVAGNVASCAQGFRAALCRGIDLSRDAAGELVPGVFDGIERPGGQPRGSARAFVAHPISRCWNNRLRCGCDDATGDDAWGHGGG